MLDFTDYINSDEFICYGLIFYYVIIPLICFLLYYIINFLFDYSSFRDYQSEQRLKMTKEGIERQIEYLKGELKKIKKP